MRETFDMMLFVNAAYAVGIASTLTMVAWSWIAMRRAERRREETRSQ